ncbi:MAG: hypothetical protein AB7V26_03655 [Lysobacterales bacterium]
MQKNGKIALALALAVLLAFGLGRYAATSPATTGEPASAVLEHTPTIEPTPATAGATGQARTALSKPAAGLQPQTRQASLPLPAPDAPLASFIDELRERADQGDARAACRLAAELRHCETVDVTLAQAQLRARQLQQMKSFQRPEPATEEQRKAFEASAKQRADYEAGLEKQIANALQATEHCAAVPRASPREQVRYWRQAALAGHLPSMAMYASGNVFRMRNSLAHLPDLEVYRHEAPALAKRAALAGDNQSLIALAWAYGVHDDHMNPGLLAQAVTPDPGEALSLLLLAQRRLTTLPTVNARQITWLEQQISAARELLDPAQTLAAERLASERFARYPNTAASPQSNEFGNPGDPTTDERQRCDQEAFLPPGFE